MLLTLPLAAAFGREAGPGSMHAIDVGGFHLLDAEYLPFEGDVPLRYPDDVLWGFYPVGASEAAKACALKSFNELKAFFVAAWPESTEYQALGGTTFFDLWINDYTGASLEHDLRPARLEHWPSAGDYDSGTWMWVSTVAQDGTCSTPGLGQVGSTLAGAIIDLSRPKPP